MVLRHKPEALGIQLDEQGWTPVPALIEKMQAKGMNVDLAILQEVVINNDKQRFQLSPDLERIKANQGHSVAVKLELEPRQPPAILFHGTATRFLDSIQAQGLIKGNRHHVHLSADKKTATLVGQRHGKLVILEVQSGRMYEDGFIFYRSDNGVWLTDHVPSKYF